MITVSNNETDLYTAIRTWLLTIVPSSWEVVQGQDNLVSMPSGSFVTMTSASIKRLVTNIDNLDSTGLISNKLTQTTYGIQLDFYGQDAATYAAATLSLLRDEDTPAQFPAYVVPLYGDEIMQLPLITGEEQYDERWKLTAFFQFNPVVSVGTQSATSVNVGLVPVDIFYKA